MLVCFFFFFNVRNVTLLLYFIDSLIEPEQKKKKTVEDDKKTHRKEKYSPINARERKKSETETEIEVDGMKEIHVTLSPRTPAGDPPEPEEIIKALMVCIILFYLIEIMFSGQCLCYIK